MEELHLCLFSLPVILCGLSGVRTLLKACTDAGFVVDFEVELGREEGIWEALLISMLIRLAEHKVFKGKSLKITLLFLLKS